MGDMEEGRREDGAEGEERERRGERGREAENRGRRAPGAAAPVRMLGMRVVVGWWWKGGLRGETEAGTRGVAAGLVLHGIRAQGGSAGRVPSRGAKGTRQKRGDR